MPASSHHLATQPPAEPRIASVLQQRRDAVHKSLTLSNEERYIHSHSDGVAPELSRFWTYMLTWVRYAIDFLKGIASTYSALKNLQLQAKDATIQMQKEHIDLLSDHLSLDKEATNRELSNIAKKLKEVETSKAQLSEGALALVQILHILIRENYSRDRESTWKIRRGADQDEHGPENLGIPPSAASTRKRPSYSSTPFYPRHGPVCRSRS